MMNIHIGLIEKTSKLVEIAKKSRFGGFFSPRKLINRINLGNFSEIACARDRNNRRALSPCVNTIPLIQQRNTILPNDRRLVQNQQGRDVPLAKFNFRINSAKKKLQNMILSNAVNSNTVNKRAEEDCEIDEDYILNQKRIKSNFLL